MLGYVLRASLGACISLARLSIAEIRDYSQSIMLIFDASFLADNFSLLLTLKGFKSPTELPWYLKLRKTFSRNEFVPQNNETKWCQLVKCPDHVVVVKDQPLGECLARQNKWTLNAFRTQSVVELISEKKSFNERYQCEIVYGSISETSSILNRFFE